MLFLLCGGDFFVICVDAYFFCDDVVFDFLCYIIIDDIGR
jgi:hypothetical protein